MAVLGIDFDGVIHDHHNVLPGHTMGQPMPGAVEAIQQLARFNTIYVFTARATHTQGRIVVEQWLDYFHIPYQLVTALKLPTIQVFIDDRGYRFHSWEETIRELPRLVK